MNGKERDSRFGLANFERRKYPRFLINLPVEYRKLDHKRNCPGRTVDLSQGGLLLHVSDEMDIGQDLKITLFIDSDSRLEQIEAKARVVWKDYKVGNDGFQRVGVYFLEINPDHREKLKRFLNNLSKIGRLEGPLADRFFSK